MAEEGEEGVKEKAEWSGDFTTKPWKRERKETEKVDRTLDLPHTGLCGEGGRQLGCASGVDDVLQHKDLMGRANHGL